MHDPMLPSAFRRLAWFNLLAQSAEQVALAAVPLAAVLPDDAPTPGGRCRMTSAASAGQWRQPRGRPSSSLKRPARQLAAELGGEHDADEP